MATNQFIPIDSLPELPGDPTNDQDMVIQAAGATYKFDARKLPLSTDTFLTWVGQVAALPGSRMIQEGSGISIDLSTPGVATFSAVSGGTNPITFDSIENAALGQAQVDNFNAGMWAGGLSKNGLRLTPAPGGGTLLTGIDTSGMLPNQLFALFNVDTVEILVLANESTDSDADNRFALPFDSDFPIMPGQNVFVLFDAISSRMRIL